MNKTLYFGSSGSFEVIDVDKTEKLITSACCDKAYPCLSARLAKNGKITTFMGVPLKVSLNLENRDLEGQNLCSTFKISYAACSCLSQLILAQFALQICVAA